MNIPISYVDVKRRYPQQVEQIMSKLRRSRSREKNAPEHEIAWSFDWCVRVTGYSFQDILDGRTELDRQREDAMSIDERIRDYEQQCTVRIKGHKRNWTNYSDPILAPEEILGLKRIQLEEDRRERIRIDSLSPEELQREQDDILRELVGQEGFAVLNINMGR